ncbi:MAG: hypothetical protein ACI4J0_00050 [Huintestinicola sp.]|uniref:hypothetical protein n=1 Tax=Huintestinicola sp. TaxID=2981661 RepID=UPI003EFF95C3
MMKRDFYAYREQNQVIPPLDFIRYPDGNTKIIGAPPRILSQWAINSKPAGNLNKGEFAGKAAKAAFSFAGEFFAMGAGIDTGFSGMRKAGANIGDAITAVNNSNMHSLAACVKQFRQWEESRWKELYLLYSFEPAEGKIGEIYKGARDNDGFVGHCFEKNGDYFEGFFANNGTRLGIFVFANGDRVFGTMYNGSKYNNCYCLGADGSRVAGKFDNNELIDGVIMTDSCAFCGQWQNGQLHGVGYARYADNSCFAGEWSHGRPIE